MGLSAKDFKDLQETAGRVSFFVVHIGGFSRFYGVILHFQAI